MDASARAHAVAALPGSPTAVDHGCLCPGLANASYRVGATSAPLIDPECELHRAFVPGARPGDGR